MSHYLSSNCWLVRREILYLPWLQTFKPAIFNLLICWAQPFHVSVNHIPFLGAGSKGLLARNPVPSKRYSVRMFGERSGSNALPLVWSENFERRVPSQCRPRHLTTIQNYEICLRISPVLLRNGTQV